MAASATFVKLTGLSWLTNSTVRVVSTKANGEALPAPYERDAVRFKTRWLLDAGAPRRGRGEDSPRPFGPVDNESPPGRPYAGSACSTDQRKEAPMARFSPTATPSATVPSRKYADSAIGYLPAKPRAPRTFAPAADDPLLALQVEIGGKLGGVPSSSLTPHGKPVGGVSVFGARRAPARRAAYRTPPR